MTLSWATKMRKVGQVDSTILWTLAQRLGIVSIVTSYQALWNSVEDASFILSFLKPLLEVIYAIMIALMLKNKIRTKGNSDLCVTVHSCLPLRLTAWDIGLSKSTHFPSAVDMFWSLRGNSRFKYHWEKSYNCCSVSSSPPSSYFRNSVLSVEGVV